MVSLSYLIRTYLSSERRAEPNARKVVSRGKDSPVFLTRLTHLFRWPESLGRVLTLSANRRVAKIRPR
jgi:hypothetical protein